MQPQAYLMNGWLCWITMQKNNASFFALNYSLTSMTRHVLRPCSIFLSQILGPCPGFEGWVLGLCPDLDGWVFVNTSEYRKIV